MDYAEFTRHVNKAGLQLKQFAALIDVYPPSISRYSGKQVPARYAVLAVLLGDLIDRKLINAPQVLGSNGLTWPTKDEKVMQIADFRNRSQGKGKPVTKGKA